MSMSAATEVTRLDMVEKEKIEALLDSPVPPAPTLSDAGKVLTVHDAGTGVEWKTASGGGGMVVHVVNSALDKTYAELVA